MSEAESSWHVEWYRKDDIALVRYVGYLSDELLTAGMDALEAKFDEAQGELRIYIIADETAVTGFSPTLNVTAVLHPGFFHPRAGKLYIVGIQLPELRALNGTMNIRRPDSVRFMDTVEEAAADIALRRAAYFARNNDRSLTE